MDEKDWRYRLGQTRFWKRLQIRCQGEPPPIPTTGPFNEAPGEHWLQPLVDQKNDELEPPRVGEIVGLGALFYAADTERWVQLIECEQINEDSYYILGQRTLERVSAHGKKYWLEEPYFVVGVMRLHKYETRIWEWEIPTGESQRYSSIFEATAGYASIQDDWGL